MTNEPVEHNSRNDSLIEGFRQLLEVISGKKVRFIDVTDDSELTDVQKAKLAARNHNIDAAIQASWDALYEEEE